VNGTAPQEAGGHMLPWLRGEATVAGSHGREPRPNVRRDSIYTWAQDIHFSEGLTMRMIWRGLGLAAGLLVWVASSLCGEPPQQGTSEVVIKGGMQCNGMCIPDPKPEDHVMVIFAVDGSPVIAAKVKKIMDAYYPDQGLDADAAVKLQEQFNAQLKFYIAPDSTAPIPALKPNHYDGAAKAVALTGTIYDKDGKHWIRATKIEDATLKYPARMLAADRPFVMPDKEPLVLRISPTLTLPCIHVPAGRAMLGAPFYMAMRYQEEYPRVATLTKSFYLSEIPITQDIWEAVMGNNPSKLKDPKVPVQNPPFAEIDRFCRMLSEKTGRKVRLPTAAEWEYTARVGTSNPGFPEKYDDQNSRGKEGWESVLPVKSKKSNAWGFYDMPSCWWEVTGDAAKYPARKDEIDPSYPATPKEHRTAMGIPQSNWTISMREFDDETGMGYTSNKFRVVVEEDAKGR
jgi:formylglycine-generating enzyme required for sulfatase activity